MPTPRKPRIAPAKKAASSPGRKPKLMPDEPTLKILRGLGQLQCTVKDCAKVFGVAVSTFEEFLNLDGVRDAFEQGAVEGQVSLRRKQFKLAEKNAAMAIFLGKNYLGQVDRVQTEHMGEIALLTPEQRRARIAELEAKRAK